MEIITKEAQQKVDELHRIYEKRGITEEEADVIWEAVAIVCALHLQRKEGAFYEAQQAMQN